MMKKYFENQNIDFINNMNTRHNYQALANAIIAHGNCISSGNQEWLTRWEKQITQIIKKDFPHGSGFDCGTKFDIDDNLKFDGSKLVFTTEFHHMNEDGYYDGWTSHKITVKPCLLSGFTISISGPNRNDIKELIHDWFYDALHADCTVQA